MLPARPPSRPSCALHGLTRAGLLAVVAVVAVLAVGASVGGCGSAIDDRPAKWSFIAATIVEPNCATVSCHSAVAQRAGVDLSARDIGYKVLLERHFVLPFDSCYPNTTIYPTDAGADGGVNGCLSAMMALMQAEGSIRMPPDLPIPQADIALIGKWITNGAPND